ncbi:hypothetical protein [Luteolibacter marinus]|uniref:hypothetical protein n=1 Tax=Luteolibacter marinus TaxID=2776705 RepID=UPI001868CF47|nr:hypothetical protein [Luteolibacter marinus]
MTDVRDLAREMARLEQLQTPEKVGVTKAAFYDLDAAVTRTTNTSAKAARSFKMTNDQLMQLAYFADDAQYGIRGIGNNLPGLALAFGKSGAAAAKFGLAVSGIAIAIPIVEALVGAMSRANKETEDWKVSAEELADAFAKGITNQLEAATTAAEARLQLEEMLNRPNTEGRAAEDKAFDARQDNIAALLEATRILNELMGRQVVAQEALAAAEAERARQREEETQHAIELEKRKEADAKVEQSNREKRLAGAQDAVNLNQLELNQQYEKLEVLKQQGIEAEKIREAAKKAEMASPYDTPGYYVNKAEADIQKRFGTDSFRSDEITKIEKAIADLETRRDSLERKVGQLYQAVVEGDQKLQDIIDSVGQQINTILSEGEAKAMADTAAIAMESQKAIVDKIKESITAAESTGKELGTVQTGSLETLKEVVSDGKVTADESVRVLTSLQVLQGTLGGNITRFLAISEETAGLLRNHEPRLRKLEQLVGGIRATTK